MSAIKNVAIAGASGSLGSIIFKKLVEAGFSVKVLTRAGSSSKFPSGTDVAEVDYESLESLKAALEGQDAFISTLNQASPGVERRLADAAAATGIKRFIPSDFGSNLDVPRTRKLPVYVEKVKIQDHLIELSKTTSLSYTVIYNAAFLDWGLEKGFLLDFAHPEQQKIYDGGDVEFSATTLPTIATAVVGVLNHLEETKNRSVYIQDTVITQNKVLALAKQLAPGKPWGTIDLKLDDVTAKADERLAKGLYDFETFAPYLFRGLMDPTYGAKFEKTDNALLGIKGFGDEGIIEIIKPLVQ
ncbi:hypothetical protein G7046_g2603 [Stylonectria norvegica]|nr:hypothetical protein G7046_g2603 [Stylonectria norvegica]